MARSKGIVLEQKEGQAIILTSLGEYKQVRVSVPLEIGELYEAPAIMPWKYALVAGFILALIWGGFDYKSVQAYAQVSPSLELGVNRWHRVVTVRALDDNGEKTIQQSHLVGQSVDQAAEIVFDQAIEEGNIEQVIDFNSPEVGTDETNVPADEKITKVFPVQAADKGNKDEAFIQKVEANMNQGLQKSLDKHKSKLEREKQKNTPSRGSKAKN
jgi:hypothetical protein